MRVNELVTWSLAQPRHDRHVMLPYWLVAFGQDMFLKSLNMQAARAEHQDLRIGKADLTDRTSCIGACSRTGARHERTPGGHTASSVRGGQYAHTHRAKKPLTTHALTPGNRHQHLRHAVGGRAGPYKTNRIPAGMLHRKPACWRLVRRSRRREGTDRTTQRWLSSRLADGLTAWLAAWLAASLAAWLAAWLAVWLLAWLTDWLAP